MDLNQVCLLQVPGENSNKIMGRSCTSMSSNISSRMDHVNDWNIRLLWHEWMKNIELLKWINPLLLKFIKWILYYFKNASADTTSDLVFRNCHMKLKSIIFFYVYSKRKCFHFLHDFLTYFYFGPKRKLGRDKNQMRDLLDVFCLFFKFSNVDQSRLTRKNLASKCGCDGHQKFKLKYCTVGSKILKNYEEMP